MPPQQWDFDDELVRTSPRPLFHRGAAPTAEHRAGLVLIAARRDEDVESTGMRKDKDGTQLAERTSATMSSMRTKEMRMAVVTLAKEDLVIVEKSMAILELNIPIIGYERFY